MSGPRYIHDRLPPHDTVTIKKDGVEVCLGHRWDGLFTDSGGNQRRVSPIGLVNWDRSVSQLAENGGNSLGSNGPVSRQFRETNSQSCVFLESPGPPGPHGLKSPNQSRRFWSLLPRQSGSFPVSG